MNATQFGMEYLFCEFNVHSSIHPKKTKREKKLTNNYLEMLEFCRIANKEHR